MVAELPECPRSPAGHGGPSEREPGPARGAGGALETGLEGGRPRGGDVQDPLRLPGMNFCGISETDTFTIDLIQFAFHNYST